MHVVILLHCPRDRLDGREGAAHRYKHTIVTHKHLVSDEDYWFIKERDFSMTSYQYHTGEPCWSATGIKETTTRIPRDIGIAIDRARCQEASGPRIIASSSVLSEIH